VRIHLAGSLSILMLGACGRRPMAVAECAAYPSSGPRLGGGDGAECAGLPPASREIICCLHSSFTQRWVRFFAESGDRGVYGEPVGIRVLSMSRHDALTREQTVVRIQAMDGEVYAYGTRWSTSVNWPQGRVDHLGPVKLTPTEARTLLGCIDAAPRWPSVLDVGEVLDGVVWLVEVSDQGRYYAYYWQQRISAGEPTIQDSLQQCRDGLGRFGWGWGRRDAGAGARSGDEAE
jgi:hypothetical protein